MLMGVCCSLMYEVGSSPARLADMNMYAFMMVQGPQSSLFFCCMRLEWDCVTQELGYESLIHFVILSVTILLACPKLSIHVILNWS